MANTKKATRKSSTTAAKRTTTKKATTKATTTVRTVSAKDAAASAKPAAGRKLDSNLLNIVLAELVGTFVLTMVALMTAAEIAPLFVGLTLALLVMAIGAVSGSHVNPAVTFGLWSARKLKSAMLPFYWGAQFLGAMAAVVISSAVAGTKTSLDFGHFTTFSWPIFSIELIATGVFLFGIVSVVNRADLSASAKALGVGLSLFVAIVVSSSLYAPMRTQAITDYQTQIASVTDQAAKQPDIPHELYVEGATLNPAIALAVTEVTESKLTGAQPAENEKMYSRLTVEVITATLLGAVVGANLSLLVNRRLTV